MRPLQSTIAIEQAYRLQEAGDLAGSELLCSEVLRKNRHDLQAIRLMGLLAYTRGDYSAAAEHLQKCLASKPNVAMLHYDLGQVRRNQGRLDDAISCFNRALKHNPKYLQALGAKAEVLHRRGDNEAAAALLMPHLEAGTEDEAMATVLMRLLDREGRTTDAIALGERHRARRASNRETRGSLLRLLGRLYEKISDYRRAFDAFLEANRRETPYDIDGYIAQVDVLLEVFSAKNLARVGGGLPRAKNASTLPVFIACMPRSGSTLVEQIIHAHPQAHGAGELTALNDMFADLPHRLGVIDAYPECFAAVTQEHIDAMAGEYLSTISRINRGAQRIVNKHLHNYHHLGAIQCLFPNSRIVHTARHPLDNCMGIFMADLAESQYPWMSDLTSMGLVWRQYERVMQHWHEVLDLPILDLKYEELVDDPDGGIRRIIEFVGLPWDDRCLRYYEVDRDVGTLSYEQVRKPIFKSAVKRYERYEPFLGPLRAALGMPVL